MKMKVTVTAPDGRSVAHKFDANEQGDIETAIAVAFDNFRISHRETLWESTIRLEHA
jgi:hypothetical protein